MKIQSPSLNVVLDKGSQGVWNSVPYLTALIWLNDGYLAYYQHLSLILILSSIGFGGAERSLISAQINLTHFLRQTLGLRILGIAIYILVSTVYLETNLSYLVAGAAIISFNRTPLIEYAYLGKHVTRSLWPQKFMIMPLGILARFWWRTPEAYLIIFSIETLLLATAFTLGSRPLKIVNEIPLRWADYRYTLAELILVFIATKLYLMVLPEDFEVGNLKLLHVFDYLPFLVGLSNNLMHVNRIALHAKTIAWVSVAAFVTIFIVQKVGSLDLVSTAYLATKVFATLSTFIAFTFYKKLDFKVVFNAGLIAFVGVIVYFPTQYLLHDLSIFWFMLGSQALCFAYFLYEILKSENAPSHDR